MAFRHQLGIALGAGLYGHRIVVPEWIGPGPDIKGLEFEAVFFVGVDRLHESLGPLFGQLFYVGASRAAVYLGISAERSLPTILEPVRGHFAAGGWGLEA